jgi:hypothetical protein
MKVPSILKKVLKGLGVTLVLLVASAIAIPYFFKDKIVARVKTAINENVNAKVDFKSVDISAFKHFPSITITLQGLDVEGIGDFEGTKLLHTDEGDVSLNFWSVWNGGNPYKVNSIHLVKPLINIVKLSNGNANYLISKPAKAGTVAQPSNFELNISAYTIKDGGFIYDDRGLGFFMNMNHLNHQGSGDLTADIYDLDTHTQVDSLTVSYGAVTYLKNANAKLDAIVNADMKQHKFTLKNNDALVNIMQLKADGWIQMLGENIAMDIKYYAPSSDFKNLLSIIPNAYTKGFENVKAAGKFDFKGYVKGTYNGKEQKMPAFAITTNIANGSFQYPSLPLGVTDINTNFSIESPSQDYDQVKIDVPAFKMKLGNNPFDAVFHLRTPVSDPDIDAKVNGTINLDDVAKAFPIPNLSKLSGIVAANIVAKTKMSSVTLKKYELVNMSGDLKIDKMNVAAKDMPAVFINDLAMNFTPNKVDVSNFDAKLGKSDLKASGVIDNILAYFSTSKTMTGNLTFSSALFDANEWIKPNPALANTGKNPTDQGKPFDRFNFTLNGKMDKILYGKYDISNSTAKGNFTPNRFEMSDFATQIGNSDLRGKGVLTNVFNFLFDNQTLGGQVDLASNMMDLNQFMTEVPSKTATNTATQPILIPKNIDVTVTAKMARVLYTNYDMSGLTGKMVVQNEEIRLEDTKATVLGGQVGLKGGYNTQSPTQPIFKMNMDVKNMEFQKAFASSATFSKLAPIAQYIKGRFNTNIDLSGAVGKDMMPDLNTLNMQGFINTIQGALSGFKPLEDISNKLNISELKNLELKDTKNWLEVKDGAVTIKEFDQKVKDIGLKIGGTHSLKNEMSYSVKAKVPRKLLEKNGVGQAAGNAYNILVQQASKYGVKIDNGEFINVQFAITGSMLAPKVDMKILGADGKSSMGDAVKDQAGAIITKAKDSVTTRANEELDKAKAKAKDIADKAVDSLTRVANAKLEEAKNKAIEEAKKQAGDAAGKLGTELGKKAGDEIQKQGGDQLKKETDKLKDKLDQWNPLGKKKGGGQ